MATFLVNNMTIKEAHQKNKPKELGPPTLSFTSHLLFATKGKGEVLRALLWRP